MYEINYILNTLMHVTVTVTSRRCTSKIVKHFMNIYK